MWAQSLRFQTTGQRKSLPFDFIQLVWPFSAGLGGVNSGKGACPTSGLSCAVQNPLVDIRAYLARVYMSMVSSC